MAKWVLDDDTPFSARSRKEVLRIWKLWEEAHLPEYGSDWAACFDLKASLRTHDKVSVWGVINGKSQRKVDEVGSVHLYHDERMLVPTGLVFDLDADQSLRIHPRSGTALKNGVTVFNCEGIVDADYVQQTYVMLWNNSGEVFRIKDGMRIAQGEIVKNNQVVFELSDREPEPKTNRVGGFGSTGKN
jgi:dUTP pyrophosphatase